jgi:hypothetical protein
MVVVITGDWMGEILTFARMVDNWSMGVGSRVGVAEVGVDPMVSDTASAGVVVSPSPATS